MDKEKIDGKKSKINLNNKYGIIDKWVIQGYYLTLG